MNIDKQVYFERRWTRCTLLAQKGTSVTVRLTDGTEFRAPFQHVRDIDAECKDCGRLLWGASYQAHSGDSYCVKCYEKMEIGVIDLLFGGYQWISWDGQMSIREMDDDHLINTLGRLRRNAEEAAELTGGSPEEHLSRHFPHLVDELRRRRPEDIGSVKMNSMLLAIWAVIMTILIRAGYTVPSPKPVEPQVAPVEPPKRRKKEKKCKTRRSAKAEPSQIPW